MKKLSKILALVLALIMVASLFGGCNQAKSDATDASGATGGNKPSGEKTVLTVEIFDRGQAFENGDTLINNEATRWINKEFGEPNNIEVRFVPIPRLQEKEKLNLLMAGKTAPDIVFTYDKAMFYKYAKDGGLADLSPYLDSCPNLKEALDGLHYCDYDGKMMGVNTGRRAQGKYSTGLFANFIRKDWLDKLGLKEPANTDELYECLKAFKEAGPEKLGVQKVIPMGMSAWHLSDEGIQGNNLNLCMSFVEPMTEEQKATMPFLTWPGWKESVRYMNKLYNEGLIDPDFAMQNDEKIFWKQVANGETGFWSNALLKQMSDKGSVGTLLSTVPGAAIKPVNCFRNSEGKTLHRTYSGEDVYIMVPSFSKNVEAAMKYMDFITNYENGLYLRYGTEGKNYEIKDGILVTKGKEQINWAAEFMPRVFFQFEDEETWLNQDKFNVSPALNEIRVEARRQTMTDMDHPFEFDRPLEMSAKHTGNLNKKFQDVMVKSITCAPADFDSTYDSGVEEYMAMGGQEVMDEKIEVYKDMQSKK